MRTDLASTAKRHELTGADSVQVVAELKQRRLASLYGAQGRLLRFQNNTAQVDFGSLGQHRVPIVCIAPIMQSLQ